MKLECHCVRVQESELVLKDQNMFEFVIQVLKTNITVLACTSAGGYVMPPFIIYQQKNLVESLIQGEIPGTMYGMNSNSGWMDGELFQQWFEQHFLRYAPATRPLLLLLDGHASHYSPSFIREAAGRGVIVFCLPPHTTHIQLVLAF